VYHDETGWTVSFLDGEKEQPAGMVFEMALAFWSEFIWDQGIARSLDDAELARLQIDDQNGYDPNA
jgi:hypothetical protein